MTILRALRGPFALASFAVLVTACNVFDPALYVALDAAPPDASPDTAAPDGGFALANECGATPPLLPSMSTEIVVDTTGLLDDVTDIRSCAGTLAPGRDGFFSVEMMVGERWHFHVTALEAAGDPIVYVLGSSCDARTCQRGDATNHCNLRDEHFSFVAPSTGTFHVGVDDANDRGGTYTVLPIRPSCGNGMVEHSEACDGGAGCTDECLRLLAAGSAEAEPNDDPPGANVLDFTSGIIQGDVASQCDLASFRFTAAAGASLTATVLPRGSATCRTSSPGLDLELLSVDGRSLFGSVSAGPGECPQILGTEPFASALAAGDYVLRLVPTDDETGLYPFDLTIDVSVP